MQNLRTERHTAVRAGDLVSLREALWRVVDVRACQRARIVRLIGAEPHNHWQPRTIIEPFDRPCPITARGKPCVVSRRSWVHTLGALAASAPAPECPVSVAGAQVALLPHQIEPLAALLRGDASRLLLADEVGLGKTIQAALILRELRARGRADRTLIVVPPGLRDQWRHELRERAGLTSTIVDAHGLTSRTRELPPDVSPWHEPGIRIVSVDFIRQPHVLHALRSSLRDLLIVDEAHGLSAGTDRAAAIDVLARHSRHVLLLTATPHHGSDEAFMALCRIGQLNRRDDPIAIFRRARRSIGPPRARRVHVLRVAPTPQERWMRTLLARYAHRVAGDAAGDAADARRVNALLALSVLIKRASSSAWSFARSVSRRLELLAAEREQREAGASSTGASSTDDGRTHDGRLAEHGPGRARVRRAGPVWREHAAGVQTSLPLFSPPAGSPDSSGRLAGSDADADADDEADRAPDDVLGAPGLMSARVERAWLRLLLEAARNAARAESKPRALKRWLRRTREGALIYTEYRDTLERVAAAMPAEVPCAALHGGLGAEARREALRRFTSGEARVLLTTDAAGEGLNLHHRCRVVINVELPWNPNRLEQRIGRVDRLGQTRTVHAVHLVAADSPESRMLDRLMDRIHRIAASLGAGPDVLRAAHAAREGAEATSGGRPPRAGSSREPPAVGPGTVASDDAGPAGVGPLGAGPVGVGPVGAGPLGAGPVGAGPVGAGPVGAGLVTAGDIIWPDRSAEARLFVEQLLVQQALLSRGDDPLLRLERRGPFVAMARRRVRGARGLGVERPGLLCVWRTRLRDADADGRARTVLTAAFVRCTVPRSETRRGVLARVTSTLHESRHCLDALLDRELRAARDRIDAAERTWRERLARRGEAITRDLARTRGPVQPLLFGDLEEERLRRTAYAHHPGVRLRRTAVASLVDRREVTRPSVTSPSGEQNATRTSTGTPVREHDDISASVDIPVGERGAAGEVRATTGAPLNEGEGVWVPDGDRALALVLVIR